ncbi:MAG TPA: hypothetical protein DCS28_02235 [Candidatus Moranbacteria bacterium]|nr:hypothetical protein [Candidatus Moranbacteria bacterium]HAT74833.1 hypothetical protein [Candidatus Moranbacteria bacterium]
MEENNLKDLEVKNLLEENLRLTKEIHQMSRKISRYVAFQKVLSVIYFLLIIVPIIISIIYLPPLVKNIISPYQELLNGGNNLEKTGDAQNIESILKTAGEVLNQNKK